MSRRALGGGAVIVALWSLLGTGAAGAATVTAAATRPALPACTIYWTGRSGTDLWPRGANWSLTDGGPPAGRIPGTSDDVCMSSAPVTDRVVSSTGVSVHSIDWPATGALHPTLEVQAGVFTANAGPAPVGAVLYGLTLDGGTYVPRGTTTATSVDLAGGQLGRGPSGSGVLAIAAGGAGTLGTHCCGVALTGAVTLRNNGTLTVGGQAATTLTESASIENAGGAVFRDGAHVAAGDSTATAVVNDAGATLTYASTDAGALAHLDPAFTNDGSVTVQTASLVAGTGGTFGAASNVAGSGSLVLDGTATTTAVAGARIGNTTVESGTLAGSARAASLTLAGGTVSATVSGPELNLDSGTVSGPGTLTLGLNGAGELAADGPVTLVAGARIVNRGTMTQFGDVTLAGASIVENAAILDLADTASVTAGDASATRFVNDRHGALSYRGDTAASTAPVSVRLTNSGTLTVVRGSLALQAGGSFGPTSVSGGAGTLVLTGDATTTSASATFGQVSVEAGAVFAGQGAVSALRLDGGVVTAAVSTDDLLAATGTIAAPATVTVNPGGTGSIASSGTVTLDGAARLVNHGILTQRHDVDLTNGAVLENAGTVLLGDQASFSGTDGSGVQVRNDAGATVDFRPSSSRAGVDIDVPLTNDGTVNAERGVLRLDRLPALSPDGTLTGGTYQALGGSIFLPAPLTSNAATLVTGPSGGFTGSGIADQLAGLTSNSGTLVLGHAQNFAAEFANSGSVTVRAGTAHLSAYTQSSGRTTVAAGATLRAGNGAGPVTITSGTLTGNGSVAGSVGGTGTVEPGRAAPSPLSVGATYTPSSGSTLDITVGGPALGDGYGQLAVGGTATLTGATLDLAVDPGATLTNGTTFAVVQAGAVAGTFAAVTGLTFGNQRFVVGYGPTSVTVTVEPVS